MKKLFLLGAVFAAGLLMTACSSDSNVPEEPVTNIADKFDAKGEAKVSFLISTATSSPMSRADGADSENDNYVVGDAGEYAIKDATLILFQGTSGEASSTYVGAYQLTASSLSIQDTDVSDLYTATISNAGISTATGNKLYALVMANAVANNVLTESSGTWSLNSVALSSTTTFAGFQKTELAAAKLGNQTTGMLMSNAPLSEMNDTKNATAPESKPVHILVEVTGTNIATTESSASANPVRVYIERAAAKVQVVLGGSVSSPLSGTIASGDVKWITDNKEATFYTVRVPGEESGNSSVASYRTYTNENLGTDTYSYRFFSTLKESNRSDDYRMYWAIDPHYSYSEISSAASPFLPIATAATIDAGTENYEYITENTFNEYGLRKDRTTRVLLSIKFNGGADFFTVNGADGIFTTGDCATDGTLAKKLLEYVKNLATVQTWLSDASHNDPTKITVEVTEVSSAGAVPEGNVIVKYNGSTDATLNTAVGNVATNMNAICYKGGLAYYQARIKHFGETHTPLGTLNGSTYTAIYGDPAADGSKTAKNFLGRYGVVRNNWYILRVTAVRKIGTATIPVPDNTPDDENDQYITTEIYVNKWAQRTQDVEL